MDRIEVSYFVDAYYDNLDLQGLQEEAIKLLIENSRGQVDASGPYPECSQGRITGVFSNNMDAKAAVSALTDIGAEAKMYVDNPVEPFTEGEFDDLNTCDPQDYLRISYAADKTWVRREIVRLLTFDLVYGWHHCGPGKFLVCCQSAKSAMSLYEKFEGSPIEDEAECDFIEDFQMLLG